MLAGKRGHVAGPWAVAALGAALLVGGLAAPAALGAGATPSLRTVTGKITDTKSGFPVPDACVYPFYVVTGAATSGAETYLPTQLLKNAGQCSSSAGYYTVSVPADLVGNLQVKALVVADKTLVSQVVDLPATSGVMNISLPVSASLIDVVPLKEAQPWADVIGVVTDHATGAVLGAGAVVKALDVKDKRLHMYAGVNLGQNTTVDVHYLVPGKAVTTDVARDLGVAASSTANTVLTSFDVGPLVEVVGRVKANASSAAPWQLVGVSCPTIDCATLGVTKADGSFDFLTTPGHVHDFHIGGVITRRTFAAGAPTMDPVQLVPTGAKAVTYASAPQTWFTPRSTVNLFGQGTWAWTGGSLTSAPLSWQRQVALGSAKTGLGAYSGWTTTSEATHSVFLSAGKSVCVRVRTLGFYAPIDGSALGTAVTQCQAAPLDERSLAYKGSWTKSKNANDYASTISTARSKGASLTLTGATGHGVGIVWTRQPSGGTAIVTVNGTRVLTINTKGATAHQKVTIKGLASFQKAKIVVTTLSKSPTAIDGVAVLP